MMDRDNALPRLPKAPFIVLDLCLIATAIVIKFSAGLTPTTMHWFWMVFCVTLGGLLACLPFLIEFRIRARLLEYDLSQTNDTNARAIAAALEQLQEAGDDIAGNTRHAESAATSLEALVKRLESRIDSMETEDRNFEALCNELADALTTQLERERELMNDRFNALADKLAKAPATQSSPPESAPPADTDEKPPPPEQDELLDEVPKGRAKARKATKSQTTLIAQVLIGIGNKPYVRGVGPGLSRDEGVAMQFLEIGKWQWTAPDATKPVMVEIFKNDEIPAEDGPIELKPGQRRSIKPRFPA